MHLQNLTFPNVTPLVGVWIEIFDCLLYTHIDKVTPLVGVWIEIIVSSDGKTQLGVTPLVGVWIEIYKGRKRLYFELVTPLVGVWIEIGYDTGTANHQFGHSPCGSVD